MRLSKLGWNKIHDNNFEHLKKQGLSYGRVLRKARQAYQVYCEKGFIQAEVSGHFQYQVICKSDFPTVGDWVALRIVEDTAVIEKVMPRQNTFSRKATGTATEEQIVVSNIDYLCIVFSLDGGRNFNSRSIERYLVMAKEGGSHPVIVLNKVDLCSDRQEALFKAMSIDDKIPIHLVSAFEGEGIRELEMSFTTGTTVAFVGPSGVGKSALVNALMDKVVRTTGCQRETDLKGRHTTTQAELLFLEKGAMVIDTPGMREMQLWGSEDGMEDTFNEIHEEAKNCRFRDCSHQGEPGCAVQQLLVEGGLGFERYQNFLDMRAELIYLQSKMNDKSRLKCKGRHKRQGRK